LEARLFSSSIFVIYLGLGKEKKEGKSRKGKSRFAMVIFEFWSLGDIMLDDRARKSFDLECQR
jgi:hypothetical protein